MDLTISFPKKLFDKQFGFGLDMGSSTIKLVYTVPDGDDLQLKFERYALQDADKVFKFIAEICEDKLERQSEVFVTGVGSTSHHEELAKLLDVRVTTQTEVSQHRVTQILADHQPWHAIFHPPSQQAVEKASRLARELKPLSKGLCDDSLRLWPYMDDLEASDEAARAFHSGDTLKYPLLYSHIGSAFGVQMGHGDGTYSLLSSFGGVGGRTFMGLTSQITGVTDFSDLVELAAKGDASKVDQLTSDLPGDASDEVYSDILKSGLTINPFGQCVGKAKADFRPEDIAAAVLSLVANSAANETYMWAQMYNVSQVIFWAGFASSHELIRREVENAFVFRRFANVKNHMCECKFLKHGAFVGSLEPLFKNLGASMYKQ